MIISLESYRASRIGFLMNVLLHGQKINVCTDSGERTNYKHNRGVFLPAQITKVEVPFNFFFYCARNEEESKIFLQYANILGFQLGPSIEYKLHKNNLKGYVSVTRDKIYDNFSYWSQSEQCFYNPPSAYVIYNGYVRSVGRDWRRYVNARKLREIKIPISYYRSNTLEFKGFKLRKPIGVYSAGDMITETILTGIAGTVAMKTGSWNKKERIEDIYEERQYGGIYESMKRAMLLKLVPFGVSAKIIDGVKKSLEKGEEMQDPLDYQNNEEMEMVIQNFSNLVLGC